jgi:uncharacterized membrane protein
MDSNKKVIIIVVTVVAVGLAIIMGVRAFTGGKVDTASGQASIEQSKGTTMDPNKVQQIREQDRRAPMGVGLLPGNKGR